MDFNMKKLNITQPKNDGITVKCQVTGNRLYKEFATMLTANKQQRGYYIDTNIYTTVLNSVKSESIASTLMQVVALFNGSITAIKNDVVLFNYTNYNTLNKQAQAQRNKKAFIPYGTPKTTTGIYSATFAYELDGLQILITLPRTHGLNSFGKLQTLLNSNKSLYNTSLNYMLTIHLKGNKNDTLVITKNNAIAFHGQALAIKHGLDEYHASPQCKQFIAL